MKEQRALQIINDIAEGMCKATNKELQQVIAKQQDWLAKESYKRVKMRDQVTESWMQIIRGWNHE